MDQISSHDKYNGESTVTKHKVHLSNSCVSCHCSLALRLAPPKTLGYYRLELKKEACTSPEYPPDGDLVALDEKLVESPLRCLLR